MSEPIVLEFESLPARARWLFAIRSFLRWIFVTPVYVVLAVAGVTWLAESWWWAAAVGGAVWFLQFLYALWYPHLAYDRIGWLVDAEKLVVVGGVWTRSEIVVPLARVQHVDSRQAPLDRWFGLHQLLVYTASGMGADVVLPGLELDTVRKLKDVLISRADADDGV